MSYQFKSKISRGGSICTPEYVEISERFVTWKKRNSLLIGVDSKTIARDKILGVEIDHTIIGANITISTYGNAEIKARRFSLKDAKTIKSILTEA